MASWGQQQLEPKSRIRDCLVVVAIEISQTHSNVAFYLLSDYRTKHQGPGLLRDDEISAFIPICLLFDEKRQLHSFGSDAENKYEDLTLDGEQTNWYYFRFPAKQVHEKKIYRDTEINDVTGRRMSAMTVFTEMIRCLKNKSLDFENRRKPISETDVWFVLTVPAVWTDSAKRFVRAAAQEAGIDGGQLTVVSEPEAVLYYIYLSFSEEMKRSDRLSFAENDPGTKYMVIQLGSDTGYVTVLEKEDGGSLNTIHATSGRVWGGSKVKEAFNQLMIAIFGAPVFKKFVDDSRADLNDLYRRLEIKHRNISPDTYGTVRLQLPISLLKEYEREMGEITQEAIANSPYAGKISLMMNGKLSIDVNLFRSLFKSCTDEIRYHVKELLRKPEIQGTTIFLMVGQFSTSPMAQNAINEILPNGKIIIPTEAEFCMIRGAAIFGHRPVAISHRVSKYTYGINVSPPFDKDRHPEDHKVSVKGFERCRDVFKKYIQKGVTMQVQEAKSGKHITLKPHQQEIVFEIFASSRQDPKFVDEDDCELLGNVVVKIPDSENRVKVEVRMIFEELSLVVEAEELAQHTKTRAYFDFL